jgi:hypothetical protein
MNNRNPDPEQQEQERREQELLEQQERALRDQLRQPPDLGDEGKDPVIINRGG